MEEWIYENHDKAKALAEMGLCDHCLGRMFGKIGTGTTNVNRGLDIREALAEEGVDAPAAEFCPLCENVFELLDRFADAAVEAMDGIESDNFLIGTRVEPEIVQREKELWEQYGLEQAEPIKAELNREIGKLALPKMHRPVEFKNPQVVALVDTRFADVSIDIAPVFIAGRYNKFSREIPQTIWPCRVCHGKGCDHCHGKGKMYDTSVQEIIGDVALEMTGGTEHFFHGMGREDIDARMLGDGRPFVLEISSPRKRRIDLDELKRRSDNELAAFQDLHYVQREAVERYCLIVQERQYRSEDSTPCRAQKGRPGEEEDDPLGRGGRDNRRLLRSRTGDRFGDVREGVRVRRRRTQHPELLGETRCAVQGRDPRRVGDQLSRTMRD